MARALGPRRTGALLSEYSAYKLNRIMQARPQVGADSGRRSALRNLALAPLALGLSRFKLPDALASPPSNPGGIRVRIAQVKPGSDPGGWESKAWMCSECVRSKAAFGSSGKAQVQVDENSILRDATVPLPLDGGGAASVKIQRMTFQTISARSSVAKTMVVYGATIDHPRFWIAVNVGTGPVRMSGSVSVATTMTLTVGHDIPSTDVDYIFPDGGGSADVLGHVDAYRSGLQALRQMHQRDQSSSISAMYGTIDAGLSLMKSEWAATVQETLFPVHDMAAITSVPELMRLVRIPKSVDVSPAGCGCSISCCCGAGGCCGCGCAIGICFPPVSPCFCCCGIGVGCGCGGCCGCDLCPPASPPPPG